MPGLAPCILGDAIEDEARKVAKTMAGIALQVARRGRPVATPCVLVSDGETTVTMRGHLSKRLCCARQSGSRMSPDPRERRAGTWEGDGRRSAARYRH